MSGLRIGLAWLWAVLLSLVVWRPKRSECPECLTPMSAECPRCGTERRSAA